MGINQTNKGAKIPERTKNILCNDIHVSGSSDFTCILSFLRGSTKYKIQKIK